MPITIFDSAILPGNPSDAGWLNFELNGTLDLVDFCKEMTHTLPATFNEVGCRRDPLAGQIGMVFQVDFQVFKESSNEVFALFGLRQDSNFDVGPTIIYGLINTTSPNPLNVQTFPSGNRINVQANQWYTLKLKLLTDQVKVYVHGGPENYNNAVLGVGPHTGIHTAPAVYSQLNVAATSAAGGLIKFRNYYVTNSLQFTPPTLDTSIQKEAWLLKEFYGKGKMVKA